MMRISSQVWAMVGALGLVGPLASAVGGPIIDSADVARFGLSRAWFTQARVDTSRGRVQSVVFDEGMLLVQTDQTGLEAIDAETGKSLWSMSFDRRNYPAMAPGMSPRMVAVVIGTDLYVLNRFNGRILWKTDLECSPAPDPLSASSALRPPANGNILSYPLKPVKHNSSEDPLPENPTAEQLAAAERE